MQFTVEDKSGVEKLLHIEIPEEDIISEINKTYNEIKQNAKIKGFRPGKAPRKVLETFYGKKVNEDVIQKLIQTSFIEVIQKAKLKIVGEPNMTLAQYVGKGSYSFDALCETMPDINDIDITGMKLEKNMYKPKDEDIDYQLKEIQKSLVKHEKLDTNRPVEKGDIAIIDFEGYLDGKPSGQDQKSDNVSLKVGEAQILKDFDDNLIGMNIDESKDINVKYPKDHADKKLAGKEILYKVKLNDIQQEILPEINDDLAKQLGKYENLNELKGEIINNLNQGYEKRVEQELNEQVFKILLDKTDFLLPNTLVEAELKNIMQDAERTFAYYNMDMSSMGKTKEEFAEKYKQTAIKQVQRALLLNKIIEQEKLELSDQELQEGLQEVAKYSNISVDEIKTKYFNNKDRLENFKYSQLEKNNF